MVTVETTVKGINDLIYGNMCGITFERKGTLGRGSDRCDFNFYRN